MSLNSGRRVIPEQGGTDLTLKGTPAKQQLLMSIVVILVIMAAAYFFIVSPR